MITIEINSDAISRVLARAFETLTDMTPVMSRVADALRDQTEDRFAEQKSPSGTAWSSRSPATVKSYERRKLTFGGILHQSGQMSGNLVALSGADFAEVGSPEPYAAMMHFGGSKAAFPHLWGNIPARPFFGLSEQNEADILDIISESLATALTP